MDVAKFIRLLGYIVYCVLWSVIIVLGIIVSTIYFITMFGLKSALYVFMECMKASIKHDLEFINNGQW